MKTQIIIVFYFCLFISNNLSQAQIVLDTTDLPKINEVQVTSIVDSSMAVLLSPGNSGANINWDFSNLFYCCVDFKNYRWTNPQNSANSVFYSESNIALKTQCYLYHNTTTHVVTEICDNLDYFHKDSTGLNYIGSDFPIPYKLNNFRNIFPLLSFGQTKINSYRMHIQLSPDSVLIRNIIDTIKADAWGTIITDFGTYNTIRIYTKESVLDSLVLNGVGQIAKYMPNNYYYKWYSKSLGFPVFRMSKGILETSPDYQIVRVARYKYQETSISEVSLSDIICSVNPNPLKTESVLAFDLNKRSVVRITISNSIGQHIASFSDNFNPGRNDILLSQLLKSKLSSGIYLLSITTNAAHKTLKLIKE